MSDTTSAQNAGAGGLIIRGRCKLERGRQADVLAGINRVSAEPG